MPRLKNLQDHAKVLLYGDGRVETALNRVLKIDTENLHVPESLSLKLFKFNHHLTFVQYALVLSGVLPCHYHDVPESRRWPGYMASFEEHVLRPWFSKHQAFLEKRGFRLDYFEDSLEFCACDGNPRQYALDCENMFDLKPGFSFWNKRHADAEKVKDVFFPSHSESDDDNDDVDDAVDLHFEVLYILGMTSSVYSLMKRPGRVPIRFDILHPQQFFGNETICCSTWMVRGVNDEEAQEAGQYFARCEQALRKFGIPIKLEISGIVIDEDEETSLSAEGYANLVMAAALGNGSRRRIVGRFVLVLTEEQQAIREFSNVTF